MPEMREVFGNTLKELGEEYPDIIVIDADLNTSTRTVDFKKRFPDRFIQAGIAEQNLFGIAAGLASEGYIPFPSTFATFASQKALDQISISIAYPKLNVKIPGSYGGLPTGKGGASHVAINDLAVMRTLPNMKVVAPGDNQELKSVMTRIVQEEGPVYFRIIRTEVADILDKDYEFQWGKGVKIKEGKDITLIGTGMMTGYCLEVIEILKNKNIDIELIHMSSLKPIDRNIIIESARKTGKIVTVENATVIGGLGSAVAEVLTEKKISASVKKIGVKDEYVKSGSEKQLFEYYNMTPDDIAEIVQKEINIK
ncbi:MAG: transketolase family protein [Bacillota bacterium]